MISEITDYEPLCERSVPNQGDRLYILASSAGPYSHLKAENVASREQQFPSKLTNYATTVGSPN